MTISIQERMARQMNRIRVEAAVAATKTPPADYVFREPVMPKKPTVNDMLKAFIEDRNYVDGGSDDAKNAPRTIDDMRRMVAMEQSSEFRFERDELQPTMQGPFMSMGQMDIERDGYRPVDQSKKAADDLVIEPARPNVVTNDIKIDLRGVGGNATEVSAPSIAGGTSEAATPVSAKQDSSDGTSDSDKGDAIGMTAAQRQMLDTMRAMRKNMVF